jgi:Thioredoxin
MNKNLLRIAAVIALVVLGNGVYWALSKDTRYTSQRDITRSQTNTNNSQVFNPTAGEYKDYSDAALVSAAGTKILFFHAERCSQCRALEEDIKASDIPDGVTIFKVKYDTNLALRKKYDVTRYATLVSVDDSGHLLKKYVIYTEPTFDSLSANLL